MRGSFFASLGLHALVIVVMIWASSASEPKAKALPSATVVKLVRPMGLPLPPGNPVTPPKGEGAPEEPTPLKIPGTGKDRKAPPEPQPKTLPKVPVAQKPSSKPGIPSGKEVKGQAGTLVVGNGDFDYDFYLATIQTKISQNFRPPPGIRAKSLATMSFTITKSGDITNIALAQSSGNLLIDQSAERAIRAAGRFPPLPSQYEQGRLDIYFEFEINPIAGR